MADTLPREALLYAAIIEFGQKGYNAASTNEIVKNANVSKGLLFHYYKSKQNLYYECLVYLVEQYSRYMLNRLSFTSGDLFDRIVYALKLKMDFCCENPDYLAMVNRAWFLERPKAAPAIASFVSGNQIANIFFHSLDNSQLRNGLDIEKIVNYTSLALEASWLRFSEQRDGDTGKIIRDMDYYIREAGEIIDLIKYGSYVC